MYKSCHALSASHAVHWGFYNCQPQLSHSMSSVRSCSSFPLLCQAPSKRDLAVNRTVPDMEQQRRFRVESDPMHRSDDGSPLYLEFIGLSYASLRTSAAILFTMRFSTARQIHRTLSLDSYRMRNQLVWKLSSWVCLARYIRTRVQYERLLLAVDIRSCDCSAS
jgi:hypothetical protein